MNQHNHHGSATSKQPSLEPALSLQLKACQTSKALPSPHCGRTPTVAIDHSGKAYVVFSQNSHVYISSTKDFGQTYSLPIALNRQPEAIYDDGENRPKILIGPEQSIFVTWTHKTPGRYSGDVRFVRSIDGGNTFSSPKTINNDSALIGHRFDTMALDSQDRLYIFWIDKRDRYHAEQAGISYRGAAIYYTHSDDLGNTFVKDKKWVDHSCECCRLALAPDSSNKLALLWRHVYPNNIRDHAISYIDKFKNPSRRPPKLADDNWQLEGCPHHGPDMSISEQNQAHAVWFSQGEANKGLMYRRYNLKNNETSKVITIDSSPGASRPQVLVSNNHVFILWKRFNGESMDLMLKTSADLGLSWTDDQIIANTSGESDHPNLVSHDQLVFATWHTLTEGLIWLRLQ